MGVSKVEFGGDTLIDLTEDSVTPETMIKGTTAHNSAGEPIEGEFDPDIYQTKTDDTLTTTDKTIVGAINEVNGKTVDKVTYMETDPDRKSIGYSTLSGIYWKGERRFYDSDENELCQFEYDGTVPIVAGDNISIDLDETNKVFKINATGGGSGGGSGGTTIKYSEGLEFEDYEEGYAVIGIGTCTDEDVLIPPEHEGMPVFEILEGAFEDYSAMKSLYIPKTVTVIMSNIFPAETVHIYCESKSKPDGWSDDWNLYLHPVEWGYVLGGGTSGSNSGGSLQMPQIRFANFQDLQGTMRLYEGNPFTFTVEIVGGGELKEGDLLQICVRRKYWYRNHGIYQIRHKWKLRKVVQREITAEDIGKRFLSINVTLADVTSKGKWMFRNDRKTSNVDTHSYMYFRIKRATKWSDTTGEECDAIFSNVEKVAKTYEYSINKLTIK